MAFTDKVHVIFATSKINTCKKIKNPNASHTLGIYRNRTEANTVVNTKVNKRCRDNFNVFLFVVNNVNKVIVPAEVGDDKDNQSAIVIAIAVPKPILAANSKAFFVFLFIVNHHVYYKQH